MLNEKDTNSTLDPPSLPTTNKKNENPEDENEIDIEEEEDVVSSNTNTTTTDIDDGSGNNTSMSLKKLEYQKRLQLVRRKMNQSRQYHQKEVRKEAEEMILPKQTNNKNHHKKKKDDGSSCLHQQAQESRMIQQKKEMKKEQNQYSIKDYHNPEGQFRNYERNITSLPTTTTTNERQGAHRLATELKRRMTKSQIKETKKRERDFLQNHLADVSHINHRNKRFNEKINRTYDKHTAEIKQNLERGTAL